MARPVPFRIKTAFMKKNAFAVVDAFVRPRGNPMPSNARTIFGQGWMCQGPQIKKVKRWRRCARVRITMTRDPFAAFGGGQSLALPAGMEH
jgi:hypothetical protein